MPVQAELAQAQVSVWQVQLALQAARPTSALPQVATLSGNRRFSAFYS